MGLLDWMAEQRQTPGMGGLFGGQYSADKGTDNNVRKAMLAAAFGLLQGRGAQAFGNAGMQGLQAFTVGQENSRRNELQDFQIAEAKRQAERQRVQDAKQSTLDALPGQFRTGGLPPTMDNRDVGQPGEPPIQPMGFDTSGYINALMGIDPMKAIGLHQAMQKDETPIVLGDGGMAINRAGKVIASNPKDVTDKTPEAIRAIDLIYPPGTPENAKARRDYLAKMTTHQPAATMNNYGSPVAGIDPTTGLPAFAVTNKTGEVKVLKDIAPPAKDVPASTREKMAENTVAIQKIDAALTDLSANPNALGAKNYIPDAIIQRTDPKGVQTRAGVADIGSQKIHDRSGASVTVSEAPRLMPFVPLVTDNPQVAETKLRRLRSEYVAMQQALQSGASIRQAVAAPKGATKTVVRTGSHNGRKVQEMSDGSIEYAD